MRGDSQAQVTLSPIATPLPLTFIGLLIATTILAGLELGWIPRADAHSAGWALLGVPVPLQLLAAVFGFHGRSAAAATGSSTLAAAWLGISLDLINSAPHAPLPSNAVAMLCFGVCAALLIPAVSEVNNGALLPAAALAAATISFLLRGIAGLTQSSALKHASGAFGIAVAAVALYAALALELEGTAQEPVLPTLRRGQAAQALVAPLELQVESLEHEAGVRRSL